MICRSASFVVGILLCLSIQGRGVAVGSQDEEEEDAWDASQCLLQADVKVSSRSGHDSRRGGKAAVASSEAHHSLANVSAANASIPALLNDAAAKEDHSVAAVEATAASSTESNSSKPKLHTANDVHGEVATSLTELQLQPSSSGASSQKALAALDRRPIGSSVWAQVVCAVAALSLPIVGGATYYRISRIYSRAPPTMSGGSTEFSVASACHIAIYMACLVTYDILANGIAQSNGGHYPWEPIVVIMLVDALKMCLATRFLYLDVEREKMLLQSESARESSGSGSARRETSLMNLTSFQIAEMVVNLLPSAVLFAASGVMQLIVLSQLPLYAAVVWRNVGILLTAGRIMLTQTGFNMQWNQWLGVAGMLIALGMNSLTINGNLDAQRSIPILLAIGGTLCSDIGNVAYKRVLESRYLIGHGQLNLLNAVLYSETVISLVIAEGVRRLLQLGRTEPVFAVFSNYGWALVLLQALAACMRTRILHNVGGFAKITASATREVIIVFLAPAFVSSRQDWIAYASVMWVFYSVLTYSGVPSQSHLPPFLPVDQFAKQNPSVPSFSQAKPSDWPVAEKAGSKMAPTG